MSESGLNSEQSEVWADRLRELPIPADAARARILAEVERELSEHGPPGSPPRHRWKRLAALGTSAAAAALAGATLLPGFRSPTDANPASARPDAERIRFDIAAPDAREVLLVGSFNDWARGGVPLRRSRGGVWATEVELLPGLHEYAFKVDGEWTADEDAASTRVDEFGAMTSVLLVAGDNEVAP